MNTAVVSSFQPTFVLISFLVAVIGSFVALTAATQIRRRDGSVSLGNATAAGIALGGVGVWSMHFIGMMALKMDVAVAYSALETIVSFVAAILATAGALAFVARAPEKLGRLLVAGTALGMGVVVMHYLGMYGMKFGGYIQWDWTLVAASIAIAVVAATAALWLSFRTKRIGIRAGAAVVMGLAVCAMHYTGLAAGDFICTTADRDLVPEGVGMIAAFSLHTWVTIGSLGVAFMILVDQLVQSYQAEPAV